MLLLTQGDALLGDPLRVYLGAGSMVVVVRILWAELLLGRKTGTSCWGLILGRLTQQGRTSEL